MRKYMNKIKWILLFITITQTQMSFGAIYQWTDSKGKVHFSDKPQPNAKKLNIKKHDVKVTESPEDRLNRQKALANEYQAIREEKARKKRKMDTFKNKLSIKCNRLKYEILNYEDVDYLFTRDETGKKKHLSSQQKTQEIQSLKNLYADKCS
jgi:hypothetical protein